MSSLSTGLAIQDTKYTRTSHSFLFFPQKMGLGLNPFFLTS